MPKYIASHCSMPHDTEFKKLYAAKQRLQILMEETNYEGYETAYIIRYNWFGLQTHSYYFSLANIQAEWHSIKTPKTNLFACLNAIKPINYIAILHFACLDMMITNT